MGYLTLFLSLILSYFFLTVTTCDFTIIATCNCIHYPLPILSLITIYLIILPFTVSYNCTSPLLSVLFHPSIYPPNSPLLVLILTIFLVIFFWNIPWFLSHLWFSRWLNSHTYIAKEFRFPCVYVSDYIPVYQTQNPTTFNLLFITLYKVNRNIF